MNQTPHRAVFVSGLAAFLPLVFMIPAGISPFDVYGMLGTVATLGFLTAYMLVCVAAPIFLHKEGRLTSRDIVISAVALLAMGLALVGNVYPVPPPPFSYLPYIYLVLLLAGLAWSLVLNSRSTPFSDDLARDLDAIPE
jgi:amino acid transporter